MQDHTQMRRHASEQIPSPVEDHSSNPLRKISRRWFARSAAAIAAASLSSAETSLDTVCSSQQPTGRKAQAEVSLGLTAEQVRYADAKLANAIRDFGTRLSAEQRQHLRRILLYNEKMLASVRAFSLENGDPPASVLKISDR